ncbi:uncharacterized protein LOC105220441 isoform X2 [Zeugodacus cucurbitae]|uniref:uncharacterized protein LOC105220441 isoform X2 n=1 Tax=Zeugodacus cucurbitae TaxID=28588 RepID=UPI0023D8FBB2|nr:uncharacterized protein LOC105220441 isoform X2 [Zeugodacus cucurbitae]
MKASAIVHAHNWPFVLLVSLILRCQNAHSATPERQRLKTLEYANQYKSPAWSNTANTQHDDSVRLFKVQQQQQQKYQPSKFNGIAQNYQNYRSTDHYERTLYAADKPQVYFKAYHQPQQDIGKIETEYQDTDDIYHVAKQKYVNQYSLPANTYRLPQHVSSQATRPPLAAQILYAREPLSQHESAIATNKHKNHSNQLLHAPKRQTEKGTHPAYNNQLPYPPSFISITTTTTTQSPTYNTREIGIETDLNKINYIPDVFAKRQHTSLLDSYIPSWVMVRMLQQHKRQQQKHKLPKFVATHTLAYPITKSYAQK